MSWLGRIFNAKQSSGRREFHGWRPTAEAREICPELCRLWEAAITDAQTLGWFGDFGISAYDLRTQLFMIRRRCREAAKNDAYVARALQLYANNVIGAQGIKLSIGITDADGEKDKDASVKVQRAWRRWAESPEYCDVEGGKTLVDVLNLAVRNWKLEGEAIIMMDHSELNPFGIELKVLRPDSLALDIIRQPTDKERAIYNGVEVDEAGRPRGYWFRREMLPNGAFTGEPYRVPARQILHLYTQDEAEQYRGVPVFASVLKDLRIMHAYSLAELIAARVDAARVGSWKQEADGDTSKIADITKLGLTQNTEPGEDRVIPYGWDFKPDAPTRPNASFAPFTKAQGRRIASGLSVSYPTWANDLEGVSYSSIRAGTLEDREVYKMMQQEVVDRVLRPLFRRRDGWLDCFLASDLAKREGFSEADANRMRYADSWLPRRWDWVDPQSEAAAREIAVKHHWTTDSDIAAESGKDYLDNVEAARQEAEWKKAKGVDMEGTENG